LEVVFQIKSVVAIRVRADHSKTIIQPDHFAHGFVPKSAHLFRQTMQVLLVVLLDVGSAPFFFVFPSVQYKTNFSEGIDQHVQHMTDFLIRFCTYKDIISKTQIQ